MNPIPTYSLTTGTVAKSVWRIRLQQLVLGFLLISGITTAQGPGSTDEHDDSGPIQTGYAIITPISESTSGLVVFETFGLKRIGETTQAGVLSSEMVTSAALFANATNSLNRNLGLAIANPSNTSAVITITLHSENGSAIGSRNLSLSAGQQTAQFITELFRDQLQQSAHFVGTTRLVSDVPVAVVGLRFRGANFSTLPITRFSAAAQITSRVPGVGGLGAVILPHLAVNGGWSTEIVIANMGTASLTVRVDFFRQDGNPLVARMNGQSSATFSNLTIPPGGIHVLAPRDADGNSRF